MTSDSVVCLQETLLKEHDNVSFKVYKTYNKIVLSTNNRPAGGFSILIKRVSSQNTPLKH